MYLLLFIIIYHVFLSQVNFDSKKEKKKARDRHFLTLKMQNPEVGTETFCGNLSPGIYVYMYIDTHIYKIKGNFIHRVRGRQE